METKQAEETSKQYSKLELQDCYLWSVLDELLLRKLLDGSLKELRRDFYVFRITSNLINSYREEMNCMFLKAFRTKDLRASLERLYEHQLINLFPHGENTKIFKVAFTEYWKN